MLVKFLRILIIGMFVTGLSGCARNNDTESSGTSKQTVATILGAIGGAVIGAQVGKGSGRLAATAVGTLLGAWIGSNIGKSLDDADRAAMEAATQESLEESPSGQTSTWENPDTGHSGTVTPEQAYTNTNDQVCRDYQQTVTIDGETEEAFGTACRQSDGTWKVLSKG